MRTFLMCAAVAVVVMPANARAQTVTLTELEVLAQLGSESRRVQAARALVDVVPADIEREYSSRGPATPTPPVPSH